MMKLFVIVNLVLLGMGAVGFGCWLADAEYPRKRKDRSRGDDVIALFMYFALFTWGLLVLIR